MFKINQDRLQLLEKLDYENTLNEIWYKKLLEENDLEIGIIVNPYGRTGELVINTSSQVFDDTDGIDISVSSFDVYQEINKLIEIGVVEVVE